MKCGRPDASKTHSFNCDRIPGRLQKYQILENSYYSGPETASNLWIISNRWGIFGEMRQTFILAAIVLFTLFSSCGSAPAEIPETRSEKPVVAETPSSVEEPADEDVFDPSSISQEVFDSTKTDVQKLITDLNRIIKAKNYNIWVSYLGKAYLDKISSGEFLASVSAQPYMKNNKITLASAKDYFEKVVIPSRANDRVDDIAFVSQNRVKVYTINDKGERLRLYDLENLGDGWKIIN
ncbi:MAG: hypothetical protein LBB83_03300 [Treponema sp.]|jgi:hypothetical protein|nr:hypothetical protein [Treponema sp.]